MTDYFVYVVPFPRGTRTHGMLLLNDDDTASIYLDANASEQQQRRAFLHELDHLNRDDLFGDKDVRSLEPALRTGAHRGV